MEEFLPIVVDGRTVGTAIIKRKPKQATKAARAAASHISTPDDIQFCPFSDGSHDNSNRGGVGLAYKREWLPRGWAPERDVTDQNGDFVKKAWAYGHSKNNMLMEVVGIVEALNAADESIRQHLPLLRKHACTVTVKATTDCQPLLQHIAKQTPPGGKVSKAVPHQIITQIKDQILALQSHGIQVFVELHWCPRNTVEQMTIADRLAGEARKSGLAYCNATQNLWARATESAIMKELVLVLSGTIRFAQVKEKINHSSTTLEKTITAQNTTEVRQESKRIKRTANISTASSKSTADSQPGVPMAEPVLPSKPATTSNIEPSPIPSTQPTTAAPSGAQPAKAVAVKRKAEDGGTKESEGRPTKKSKLSPARPRKQYRLIMPVAWGLGPETTRIFISNPKGDHTEKPVLRAPFIRMVTASTMETGKKNVFISDGFNTFSLAKPIP